MYVNQTLNGYGWIRPEGKDGDTTHVSMSDEDWFEKKLEWNDLSREQVDDQFYWWKFWVFNTWCLKEWDKLDGVD